MYCFTHPLLLNASVTICGSEQDPTKLNKKKAIKDLMTDFSIASIQNTEVISVLG